MRQMWQAYEYRSLEQAQEVELDRSSVESIRAALRCRTKESRELN